MKIDYTRRNPNKFYLIETKSGELVEDDQGPMCFDNQDLAEQAKDTFSENLSYDPIDIVRNGTRVDLFLEMTLDFRPGRNGGED